MPTPAEVEERRRQLTEIGKLVFLAYALGVVAEQELTARLFTQMRTAYEDELTRQARALGSKQVGLLAEGPELLALQEVAKLHARSIVDTYNADLAVAIGFIASAHPQADKATYIQLLAGWALLRGSWKDSQIALMTVGMAVQRAKEDFIAHNTNNPDLEMRGQAYLLPRHAAEPRCQELIDKSPWPLEMIEQTPMPLHHNCIHAWTVRYEKPPVPPVLWMGS